MKRLQALLRASWRALDAAAEAAAGRELRKGPRGGGRAGAQIVEHVRQAELSYLGRLGGTVSAGAEPAEVRAATLAAVALSAQGALPAFGPRGGQRWTARRFVRRAAWHILDHAWEIEDRAL